MTNVVLQLSVGASWGGGGEGKVDSQHIYLAIVTQMYRLCLKTLVYRELIGM